MIDDFKLNLAGGLEIPLPRMAKVRQHFDSHKLADVQGAVSAQLNRAEITETITPGMKIAVGAGSRGIANIGLIVATVVQHLKDLGADPFVFPAMGSHGGATAEGQTEVLANYGMTEENIGAPIRATMDTKIITELPDGTPLHCDRYAAEADGIVLINRIKPHTTFRATIESGLAKMMVIGMAKISGATVMHSDHGMERFGDVIPKAATALMAKLPILFGLGLVEDAFDDTAIVEAIRPAELLERETHLLEQAKTLIARLFFDEFDVLVIDQIGKEISGSGFDPNVTGRNSRGVVGFDSPKVSKIVILDLSEATHGNATGLGLADVITRRLFNRIDFAYTYANVITSAYLDGGSIPIIMESDEDAIRLAIKTVTGIKPEKTRLVWIRDTLHLSEIEVSEPLFDQVIAHSRLSFLGEPTAMDFSGRRA